MSQGLLGRLSALESDQDDLEEALRALRTSKQDKFSVTQPLVETITDGVPTIKINESGTLHIGQINITQNQNEPQTTGFIQVPVVKANEILIASGSVKTKYLNANGSGGLITRTDDNDEVSRIYDSGITEFYKPVVSTTM